MNNTERSNMNVQSSHSAHSSPAPPPQSKDELLHSNPQRRLRAARQPSFIPHHRLSQVPLPHYFHGVNDAMAYPPRDPSRVSNRFSMGHQIEPNAFRRSYSDNVSSMLPSHPSFQTFTTRDQKWETLQPLDNPADPRSGVNPHIALRVPEMPKRSSVEPANLIHSIRDSPFSNKPKSAEGNSRRVVTGILQSALPPSARPPLLDTAPSRSMPIAELQKRHKAALQKLQTHTNQRAANSSVQSQPKPVKPQQKPSIQVNPIPTIQVNSIPSIHVKTESSSDVSPKSDSVDKSGKPMGKPSHASHRRSFFSFLTSKEETKPSSTPEEPAQSKKKLSSKEHKEVSKPASDKGEEEDEDVPLAQLRDRKASYNPTSQTRNVRQSRNFEPSNSQVLTSSLSVPINVNKLQDQEILNLDTAEEFQSHAMDPIHHLRYDKFKPHSGIRSKRASTHLETIGGFHSRDRQSSSAASEILTPGHNIPTWLQINFELSEDEKNRPRPLIFEDEAKAIRNSKRLWVQ